MRRPLLYACLASALVTAIVASAVRLGFEVPSGANLSETAMAVRPWAILGVAYLLLVPAVLRAVRRVDSAAGGGADAADGEAGLVAKWFRPSFGDFTTGVLGAIVLFGVVYAGQQVLTPAGNAREAWLVRLYLMLGDPALVRAHLTLVVLAVVVASAAEEIVWRGYVQHLLTREFGTAGGILGAALLYSLAHVPSVFALADGAGDTGAGLNPLLPLAALAGGLLWGTMVRLSKGRLVPAMIAHALFDWCVLVQFRLWGHSV